MIEIRNISKSYRQRLILDDISLCFDGKVTIIVGKNGVGKSTLLSILAKFMKPDKGEVISNKKIAFIPQADALFEDLTVKDNISFWQSISNNKNINLLGLEPFLKTKVKNLSGGTKKRVAILVSLLNNPEIVIMDEPFAGLDLFYKNELFQLIESLKNEGKQIIYTSHNIDEVFALESTKYILDKKLKKLETEEELFTYITNKNEKYISS